MRKSCGALAAVGSTLHLLKLLKTFKALDPQVPQIPEVCISCRQRSRKCSADITAPPPKVIGVAPRMPAGPKGGFRVAYGTG